MAAISGDQVAVYDRQLRLWGVQAQQRLLNAKVLVWGLEGSNVEACKNLVLAGVSLTIRDHRSVTSADVGYNYFLRPEDVGKLRAECASKRVQEMNPLCTVSCNDSKPEKGSAEKLKDLVKGFDVVIVGLGVIGFDFDLAASLDAACRDSGAGFVLTIAAGELAFFFSDLKEHVMQERSSAQGGEPAAPVAKAPDPETFSFPAFSEWLEGMPAMLQQKKCDASFQLIALVAGFFRNGGKASPDAAADFEAYCRDTAKCQPSVDGIEGGMKQAFGFFFVEPLMHVASVLGGLLSQEVIKAITKKDPPLVNSVCFNACTGAALVERLPAAPPVQKKRKAEEEVVADLLDD
eukprot:TRINITY_DN32321_c0_g1_i1.p1 TRINITY_DN32321_c0_g1~~TRINITY_DN32321_c0_g1_i1.p1  ORF type:complete len:348 (+),score=123.63 TRINITY_DN32321_c0_g1_i1:38-1081(+)